MNHVRMLALVMAAAMLLTLFALAVDQPVADGDAVATTAVTSTAATTAVPSAAPAEKTVEIKTVRPLETVAAEEAPVAPDSAADPDETPAVEAVEVEAEPKPAAEEAAPEPVEDKGTYNWGVTVHAISDADRDLIERVVAAEAQGCVYDGILGVAQVIRERAESWGMTPREVVTAKGQFAAPYRGKVSDAVKQAVSDVFDKGMRAFAGHTTHFHSTSCDPYWNDYKILRGKIDTQLFWGIDEA